MPIFYQYVLPGNTIYSDQWRAYSAINNDNNGSQRYIHQTVNHAINFVDPTTLVQTQNIANMWMVAKMNTKNQMGRHRSLLDTRLIESMWDRKFSDYRFENLSRTIENNIYSYR